MARVLTKLDVDFLDLFSGPLKTNEPLEYGICKERAKTISTYKSKGYNSKTSEPVNNMILD
jgi:hypothetical protein